MLPVLPPNVETELRLFELFKLFGPFELSKTELF